MQSKVLNIQSMSTLVSCDNMLFSKLAKKKNYNNKKQKQKQKTKTKKQKNRNEETHGPHCSSESSKGFQSWFSNKAKLNCKLCNLIDSYTGYYNGL